jgi:hypothetical protein
MMNWKNVAFVFVLAALLVAVLSQCAYETVSVTSEPNQDSTKSFLYTDERAFVIAGKCSFDTEKNILSCPSFEGTIYVYNPESVVVSYHQ